MLGKNTWRYTAIYLHKLEEIFAFNVYVFYREMSSFESNSVGVRFHAEKYTGVRLLFVNNLKDCVETFLINFKAVTYKGNQKRLLKLFVYG